MPTIKELNAGFDAAVPVLRNLIDTLLPDMTFPVNPKALAKQWLASPAGRKAVLDEVKKVLAAAEAARK